MTLDNPVLVSEISRLRASLTQSNLQVAVMAGALRDARAELGMWSADTHEGKAAAILDAALSASAPVGMVAVPREPTPEMIAATLPMIEPPDARDLEIGAAAMALLPPVRNVDRAMDGLQAAADLCRDYRALLQASGATDG